MIRAPCKLGISLTLLHGDDKSVRVVIRICRLVPLEELDHKHILDVGCHVNYHQGPHHIELD
jgi:hypothetical protein